jgi:hypothetical protein
MAGFVPGTWYVRGVGKSNDGSSFRVAKACRALPGMARDVASLFSDSGENQFLVLEDFVEGRLILFDDDLVGKNGLLIFHDGALVGEDGFLIFNDRGLVVQNCFLIG